MTIVYEDAPVRHSPTYRISTYATFKEVKYRTFERPAEFFLPGLKEQWGEGGGRILLCDNTGFGTFMLAADWFPGR